MINKIKTIVIATTLVLATTAISNAEQGRGCDPSGPVAYDPSCGSVGFAKKKTTQQSTGPYNPGPHYPGPYNPGGVGFKPKQK